MARIRRMAHGSERASSVLWIWANELCAAARLALARGSPSWGIRFASSRGRRNRLFQ